MKGFAKASLFGVLALVLGACSSIPGGDLVSGAMGAGALGGATAAVAAPAVADFQSGELLASQDNDGVENAVYSVSKVLQAATPATNNQAQVIFIEDGKKYWVNCVIDSRKATKADLTVGASVLCLRGWQNHDDISPDTYRKSAWVIASVTSVDELFKGRVEVGGESFAVKYLRIPVLVAK